MPVGLRVRILLYLLPILAVITSLLGPVVTVHGQSNDVAVIRAESWSETAADRQGSGGTRDTTSDGVRTITYDSAVHRATFDFNALATEWVVSLQDDTMVRLFVRTGKDGAHWSPWNWVSPDSDDGTESGVNFSKLLVTNASYLQYRLQLVGRVGGAMPSVSSVHFTFINSEQGPDSRSLGLDDSSTAHAAAPQPRIITRAQWGADESLRFDDQGREIWPREYTRPEKAIIHDTQTANNDPNPAATVRAIYYYHAVVRGWGDIGYNYLVDQQGNIYEGRAGGLGVVGGHARCYNWGTVGIAAIGNYYTARPTQALLNSLESLIAWIFSYYGINPYGHGVLGSYAPRDIPNIAGHRDLYGSCGNTHTDPGNYLYYLFPQIRASVWYRMQHSGSAPSGGNSGTTGNVNVCTDNSPSKPEPTYRVVKTHGTGLNLHICPNTNSTVLVNIPEGTVIHEITSKIDGWVKTTYHGKTGYVWHEYLTVVGRPSKPATNPTRSRSACPDSSRSKPEPTYRVVGTHGTGLNLHICPNTSSKVLANLPEGTVVQEITSKVDGWVKTTYHGKTGYLWYKYLEVLSKPPKGPGGRGTTKNPSSACPDNSPRNPEPTYKVVHTHGTGLNLRACPTMRSKVLAVLPEGTVVHEITSKIDGWVKTRYHGRTGYLWVGYLKVIRRPSPDAGGGGGDPLSPGTTAEISGTPGALYLREGPGMNYKPITKMWEGSDAVITGEPRGGWYPLRYRDGFGRVYTGWAWGHYLKHTSNNTAKALGAMSLAGALAVPALRRRRRRRRSTLA